MYYLSLICPDPPAGTIRAYQEWMYAHFGCRAAMKSPPHITLVPPFWFPEEKEESLKQVLSDFEFDRPAIEIHWNGFNHFGKRVLYVQVGDHPDLQGLESVLSRHLAMNLEALAAPRQQPFHPHITIAARDMTPTAYLQAWAHFSGKPFKGSFVSGSISLMKLEPGRWTTEAVYPFRSA